MIITARIIAYWFSINAILNIAPIRKSLHTTFD